MDKHELESRTKAFALRVIRFVSGLPKNKVTDVLGYQLLRAPMAQGKEGLCLVSELDSACRIQVCRSPAGRVSS